MVACPQLAKADIRPLDSNSVFDPKRSSRWLSICTATNAWTLIRSGVSAPGLAAILPRSTRARRDCPAHLAAPSPTTTNGAQIAG